MDTNQGTFLILTLKVTPATRNQKAHLKALQYENRAGREGAVQETQLGMCTVKSSDPNPFVCSEAWGPGVLALSTTWNHNGRTDATQHPYNLKL